MQVKTLLAGIVAFAGVTQMASAQSTGDYRSNPTTQTSGKYLWSTVANWQTWNGSSWVTPANPPSDTTFVNVLNAHTITVNAAAYADRLDVDSGGVIEILNGATLELDGDDVVATHQIDGEIDLGTGAQTGFLRFVSVDQTLLQSSGSIKGLHANAAIEIGEDLRLTSRMLIEGKLAIRPVTGAATFELKRGSSSVEGVCRANANGNFVFDAGLVLDDTKFVSGVSYRPSFESVGSNSQMVFDCSSTTLEGDFLINNSCSTAMLFDVSITTNGDLTFTRGVIYIPITGVVFAPANLGPYTDTPGTYHAGAGC